MPIDAPERQAIVSGLGQSAIGRRLGRDFLVRHGRKVQITAPRIEQAWALRHSMTAYDAAYAAAAEEGGHHLVSCDKRDLVSKGLAVLPDGARPK